MIRIAFVLLLLNVSSFAATIAIIDTGFDLDHDFLKPKIFKQETDEEAANPDLVKEFHGWKFHDNSHLKKPVIHDESSLQEILLFRNLRAKGHKEGLSLQEFEWFKNKSADKKFMDLVKKFKKHSHGTFVAGIALREGENINIFPIRGLSIPFPVVAVNDNSQEANAPITARTPEEKFNAEIKNSLNRVSRKFNKICHYLSLRNIDVVNASYGITYKNIISRFREKYKEITGKDIDEPKLQAYVAKYFTDLMKRGEKTVAKYPKILFVFSAGNSGLNNDLFDHYPSKIKLPNTLTVAAMNGDYLATFSNFGLENVDIGAPGVAILSLVPKVYSPTGEEIYSPSSGTSMAAPYVSNLAAQILNANPNLKPPEVKKVILETGDVKSNLKKKLSSGAVVNNEKAIKAAHLSREMSLDEAINLARSGLMPVEDKPTSALPNAKLAEDLKTKVLDSVPQAIKPEEVDDDPTPMEESTKPGSSLPVNREKAQPDNSTPPPLTVEADPQRPVDPAPSNQNEEQSPPPSEVKPSSSSESESQLPSSQAPENVPSSP